MATIYSNTASDRCEQSTQLLPLIPVHRKKFSSHIKCFTWYVITNNYFCELNLHLSFPLDIWIVGWSGSTYFLYLFDLSLTDCQILYWSLPKSKITWDLLQYCPGYSLHMYLPCILWQMLCLRRVRNHIRSIWFSKILLLAQLTQKNQNCFVLNKTWEN